MFGCFGFFSVIKHAMSISNSKMNISYEKVEKGSNELKIYILKQTDSYRKVVIQVC